jgi:hypothetical protein
MVSHACGTDRRVRAGAGAEPDSKKLPKITRFSYWICSETANLRFEVSEQIPLKTAISQPKGEKLQDLPANRRLAGNQPGYRTSLFCVFRCAGVLKIRRL